MLLRSARGCTFGVEEMATKKPSIVKSAARTSGILTLVGKSANQVLTVGTVSV